MADTNIIHKKSSVPGKIPLAGQLNFGELAVNTHDGVIYFKRNQGVDDEVVKISEVTEDSLAIDTTGFNNAVGTNLAQVLSELDSAITTAAVGGVNVDPTSILGAGTVANPFRVTLDSVLAGGNVSTGDMTVNNLTVTGTINGVTVTAETLNGATLNDIVALAIALG